MRRLVYTFIAIILTSVSVYGLFSPPKVQAATPFDPNRLMDDFVFENTGTMSASSIDTWLNSNWSSSCISSNNGFSVGDPQGWSDSNGKYMFGGNVSGGKAIYDAAQLYQVNPQVLLATLQKEQSAVTGAKGCHYDKPNPNDATQVFPCDLYSNGKTYNCTEACPFSYGGGCMNIAMSYGCPGNCNAADEGPAMQFTLGGWVLRFSEERAYGILTGYKGYESGDQNFTYSGPMTAGWRQRSAGGQSTYYDGSYTTIDGQSVNITNGATASLYTYTPFVSGNQSFDNIFQGPISSGYFNFGIVYAYDTLTPHPNGTLISSGGKVYLLDNGSRRWITNGDVFASYGYSWNSIKAATTGDNNLPEGQPINAPAPGTIFRTDNSPVYVMTYEGSNLVKQQISYAAYNSLGYSWNEVVYIPPGNVPAATASSILTANQHPAGTLVAGGGKVYVIDQISKLWILGPDAFATNNYSWSKVKQATSLDMAMPENSVVRIGIRQGTMLYSGGNIYVANNDGNGNVTTQSVGPWECFADRWHFTTSDLYSIGASALPPRSGPIASC